MQVRRYAGTQARGRAVSGHAGTQVRGQARRQANVQACEGSQGELQTEWQRSGQTWREDKTWQVDCNQSGSFEK